MACPGLQQTYRTLLRDVPRSREIPSFLAPSLSVRQPSRSPRHFSTTNHQKSRIGLTPISIPQDVSLRFFDLPKSNLRSRKADAPTTAMEVTGPLGSTTLPLPPYLDTKYDETGRKVSIRVEDQSLAHQKAMWGTMRALMQNTVAGVSEGHIAILRLVGVGYRATVESNAITKSPAYPGQQFVNLKLGYAHPIEMPVPPGVKATVPQPTRILLEGCEKQVVMQFAAEIREWRKPEPYKGKGIFVNGETIRLKAKKIK